MRTVALFPGLDLAAGGIEASGVVAWASLAGLSDSRLIVFDPQHRDIPSCIKPNLLAHTKYSMVRGLFARVWQADVALVWHIGLLKLLPAMRGFRGKVVLFGHGIELWRRHGWLTRRMLRRVDSFLTNSDQTWQRFLEHAPFLRGKPHRTVPLGFGTPVVTPLPQTSHPPAAVILGRMTHTEDYKGHRELINSWPRVRAQVAGAELWVMGDGDLRPELVRLAQDNRVAEAVRFFGRVTERRKQELLAAARCLAMPSRGEGFGLVYLEAMRLGRPCLVGDADAGREVVNPPEAGLAVDPTNPVAVANALVRLLADGSEWRTWSIAARARYETKFTAEHFQQRLRRALSEVFGG